MAEYQGHKNWNHWNVNLWLFNDEPLYRLVMREAKSAKNLNDAAYRILDQLPSHTPDGAPYSFSSVRAALVGVWG